jgi:inosine-uridine nucleoside N-ribohydrolase
MSRPAIVLDCDPGLDDAIAILCATRYADLVAITTVAGNVSLDKTTRNALVVCRLAGIEVPVHAGAAEALVPHLHTAADVHGESGLGGTVDIEPDREPASTDAPGALCALARERDDLHLVALGPLTNVALAIRRDPSFVSRLRSLTIMGGSTTGGNITAAAEFNIFVDPEAAAIVFDSGVPVRTVPLDCTHQVVAQAQHAAALRDAATPTAGFVADLLDHYGRLGAAIDLAGQGALHDPCAVLSVVHPELFGFVPQRLDIELDGRLTRGMTVVDARPSVQPHEHNAHLAHSVDARRVLQLILGAAIDPHGPPAA